MKSLVALLPLIVSAYPSDHPSISFQPTESTKPSADPNEDYKCGDVEKCGCDNVNQSDYRGTISITVSGKTCQRWDSEEPHDHIYTNNYPKSDLIENYCRNPDGEDGAWCYTTDPDKRWEYCDVPICSATTSTVSPSDFPTATGSPTGYMLSRRLLTTSFTEIIISKNNLIDTIVNPPNEFTLNFDLYPNGKLSGWRSILRYTATNNDCCNWPDRWLGMWFHSYSYRMLFAAGSTLNGDEQTDVDGINGLTWNKVRVESIGDKISLYINNVYSGHLPNTNRPLLPEVKVYAGDAYYNPANAKIRQLVFSPITTEKPSTSSLPSSSSPPSNMPTTSSLPSSSSPPSNMPSTSPSNMPSTYYPKLIFAGKFAWSSNRKTLGSASSVDNCVSMAKANSACTGNEIAFSTSGACYCLFVHPNWKCPGDSSRYYDSIYRDIYEYKSCPTNKPSTIPSAYPSDNPSVSFQPTESTKPSAGPSKSYEPTLTNSFSFTSAFFTQKGSLCNTCSFCPGSTLTSLFDPNDSATCVECETSENDCKIFKVFTTFDTAWRMWFFHLIASDDSTSYDPKRIRLEGSNNFNGEAGSSTNTWITLYDSAQGSCLSYSGQNEEETFVFSNDLNFKHYAVTFVRKPDASKLQVGSYKIVQSYAKECSSVLLEKLTGKKVPAHKTLAAIGAPTNKPII